MSRSTAACRRVWLPPFPPTACSALASLQTHLPTHHPPTHPLQMQAGVATAISSDNVRDQFYAYGDLDMLEVFTQVSECQHLSGL